MVLKIIKIYIDKSVSMLYILIYTVDIHSKPTKVYRKKGLF